MNPLSGVFFSRASFSTALFVAVLSLSITVLTLLASSLSESQLSWINSTDNTVSNLGLPLIKTESSGRKWVNYPMYRLFANQISSQIYSAAFNDVSPGFDDLYIIKTQDKGREIIIYCNTNYCYKNRNSLMTS